MKVTVNSHLNVRIGAPSVNAPCQRFLTPGTELEVDGKLYKGDKYEGIDTWLKDESDNYYWSGGVKNIPVISPVSFITDTFDDFIRKNVNEREIINKVDYNSILNLDSGIKGNHGTNVKIGILDHFINGKLPFSNSIIRTNTVANDNPPHSHGCAMSGLIAGSRGIFGIANSATIIELPIYDKNGFMSDDLINQSLNFISNISTEENYIINISQVLPKKFEDHIRSLASNDRLIMVASAGTDKELLRNELQFPSSLPNVISVGSISPGFYESTLNPRFNEFLDIVMPDYDYLTYTKVVDKYDYFGKDSCACVVVAGILSLIMSGNQNVSFSKVKKELLMLAVPYSSGIQILKTLNPINPKS